MPEHDDVAAAAEAAGLPAKVVAAQAIAAAADLWIRLTALPPVALPAPPPRYGPGMRLCEFYWRHVLAWPAVGAV